MIDERREEGMLPRKQRKEVREITMTANEQDFVFDEITGITKLSLTPSPMTIDRPLPGTSMNQFTLQVNELLSIFAYGGVRTYSPSITVSSILPINVPTFISNHFSDLGKLFRYIRCNFEVQFRLVSQFQQVGALMAVLYQQPNELNDYYFASSIGEEQDRWFEYPHKLIYFGEDSTTSITIPWNRNLQLQEVGDEFPHAQIGLHVLSPMRVATGVTARATLQVYTRLTNVELSGYINRL